MKKKLLATLLALCMVLSLLPATALAAGFDDVPANHWGEAAIDRWAGYGVLNGYGDGNFDPNGPMTRGQFASMMVQLMGYTATASNTFTDLPAGAWYTPHVLKLVAAGVMAGVGDNKADPESPITREQAARLLCVALNIQPSSASTGFSDDGSVASWAKGYVAALSERGWISGMGDGTFAPGTDVNRAQAAQMLHGMVGEYVTTNGATVTGDVDGIVIIKADNVKIENATLSDPVIVAPAAANATVTLTGTTKADEVVVEAQGAKVVVSETASAKSVEVDAPRASAQVAGKVDSVTVTEDATGATVTVDKTGTVSDVNVEAANTDVKVSGTVENVKVEDSAKGTDITTTSGAKIDNVTTAADNVKVSGAEGTVGSVTATGDGSTDVQVKGAEVKNEGEGTVKAGDKKVESGESETVDKVQSTTPSGGTGTTTPANNYTITVENGTVNSNPSLTVAASALVADYEITVAPGTGCRDMTSPDLHVVNGATDVTGCFTYDKAEHKVTVVNTETLTGSGNIVISGIFEKSPITKVEITVTETDYVYGGAVPTFEVAKVYTGDTEVAASNVELKTEWQGGAANTNNKFVKAGSQTVSITLEPTGDNALDTSVTCELKGGIEETKTVSGDTFTQAVTVKQLDLSADTTTLVVTAEKQELTYTSSDLAGEVGIAVVANGFTLADTDYEVKYTGAKEGNTTAATTLIKADTYSITITGKGDNCKNDKAVTTPQIVVKPAVYREDATADEILSTKADNAANSKTIDLTEYLPADKTYTTTVTGDEYVPATDESLSGKMLTLTYVKGDSEEPAEGTTQTVTVKVSIENYVDYTITVNVTLTGKEIVEITLTPPTGGAYTGESKGKATWSATPTSGSVPDTDYEVTITKDGEIVAADATAAAAYEFKDAGKYVVTVGLKSDSNYAAVTQTAEVEITKAPLTITASDVTFPISVGETGKEVEVTVATLLGTDKASVAVSFVPTGVVTATTPVETAAENKATFTFNPVSAGVTTATLTATVANGNYAEATKDITVTVLGDVSITNGRTSDPQTYMVGDTLTAAVEPTGLDGVTYNWYRVDAGDAEPGDSDPAIGSGATYQLTKDDIDRFLFATATYSGEKATSTAAVGPVVKTPITELAVTLAALSTKTLTDTVKKIDLPTTATVTKVTPTGSVTETPSVTWTQTVNGKEEPITELTKADTYTLTATVTVTPEDGYTLAAESEGTFTVDEATATVSEENKLTATVTYAITQEIKSVEVKLKDYDPAHEYTVGETLPADVEFTPDPADSVAANGVKITWEDKDGTEVKGTVTTPGEYTPKITVTPVNDLYSVENTTITLKDKDGTAINDPFKITVYDAVSEVAFEIDLTNDGKGYKEGEDSLPTPTTKSEGVTSTNLTINWTKGPNNANNPTNFAGPGTYTGTITITELDTGYKLASDAKYTVNGEPQGGAAFNEMSTSEVTVTLLGAPTIDKETVASLGYGKSEVITVTAGGAIDKSSVKVSSAAVTASVDDEDGKTITLTGAAVTSDKVTVTFKTAKTDDYVAGDFSIEVTKVDPTAIGSVVITLPEIEEGPFTLDTVPTVTATAEVTVDGKAEGNDKLVNVQVAWKNAEDQVVNKIEERGEYTAVIIVTVTDSNYTLDISNVSVKGDTGAQKADGEGTNKGSIVVTTSKKITVNEEISSVTINLASTDGLTTKSPIPGIKDFTGKNVEITDVKIYAESDKSFDTQLSKFESAGNYVAVVTFSLAKYCKPGNGFVDDETIKSASEEGAYTYNVSITVNAAPEE